MSGEHTPGTLKACGIRPYAIENGVMTVHDDQPIDKWVLRAQFMQGGLRTTVFVAECIFTRGREEETEHNAKRLAMGWNALDETRDVLALLIGTLVDHAPHEQAVIQRGQFLLAKLPPDKGGEGDVKYGERKRQVLALHEQHPDWSAPQIGAALGCSAATVRGVVQRAGIQLRRAIEWPGKRRIEQRP